MAELNWRAKDIDTISEFFSRAECDEYIRFAESKGFEDAPITTGSAPIMMKEVRNNDRVMFDDVDRAHDLYRRLASHWHRISGKSGSPSA
jgi:hypothetical protein